jgi:hypothetical protein
LKYGGRGYRRVYVNASFFCRGCAADAMKTFGIEKGVIASSVGFRQEIMWVIYDPEVVSREKVVGIIGAGGDVVVLSDSVL